MLGSRDNTRKKPKCLSGGGRPVNRGYTIALITSQGTQMRKAEATTKDTRIRAHKRTGGKYLPKTSVLFDWKFEVS